MLLQCWSQGTLDLVLQNTTYHQPGGVQDFSNFHRSKNLLHSTVLPALEPNWNPPFGIHQRREWLRMLASWWRSARPRPVDKAHFWGAANLLILEGIWELDATWVLEFTQFTDLLNFKFHQPVEYKTQGILWLWISSILWPLGFIIMTHPLTEKNRRSPPKKKGWHQELRQPPPPKPLPYSPKK